MKNPEQNAVTYYFGFRNGDLDSVAESLASLLGIEWEHRDGDASGGNYCVFRDDAHRHYFLQHNHLEFFSWLAPNFSSYPVILRIRWDIDTSLPKHSELLRVFSSVFTDVVFFTDAEKGELTLLNILKLEPLGLFILPFAFFAKFAKVR